MNFTPLDNDHPVAIHHSRKVELEKEARELMDAHGLEDWAFRISTTATSLGMCYFQEKVIEFSEWFIHESDEQIDDTLRHEIAHALSYKRYGARDGTKHNYLWKMICREIGANPERIAHGAVSAKPYNYVVYCSRCGKLVARKYRIKKAFRYHYTSKCCHASLDIQETRSKNA
jgi:predicted SprT family Zn-dependent metalloprotease